MARRRQRLTQEGLNQVAFQRSTKAQAEQLARYMKAGWTVTKVDGLDGYDSVVCIAMQRTPAVITPDGVVTRAGPGLKTVSYKYPKTQLKRTESAIAA